MNVFSFTGHLGRDCRTGNTPSGNAVCNFSVAVTSGYGKNEETVWVDCALWGKRAEGELPKYLTQGQKVAISGELGERTNEKDGKTYHSVTCRVNSLDLIGVKSDAGAGGESSKPNSAPAQDLGDDFEDSDIPF